MSLVRKNVRKVSCGDAGRGISSGEGGYKAGVKVCCEEINPPALSGKGPSELALPVV